MNYLSLLLGVILSIFLLIKDESKNKNSNKKWIKVVAGLYVTIFIISAINSYQENIANENTANLANITRNKIFNIDSLLAIQLEMIEEKLTNYEAVNEKLFLIDSLTNKLLNERKNINKELAYANTILSQQAKNQIAKIESERPNLIFLAADATIKQNQLSQNNYEFPFRNSGIRLAENVKLKVCFIFIDSLNILSNHYITNEIYEDTEFPSFTRAGTNRSYSIELNKSHHAGNKLMYLIFNFSYYDSLLDKYHSHVQTYYINDRNKLSSYNKINSNQLNTYIKLNNIVDFKFDF